jgi:purine-binding chemotaxis protein CheW
MEQPRNGDHGNGGSSLDPKTAPTLVSLDGSEISQQVLQQIWAERAARLAKVPEEAESGEQITLLLTQLGREIYGLDARYVDRIEPVAYLTRVPRVPEWVAGVTNLRGRVLSVVDLVRFFGLPASSLGEASENGDPENMQQSDPYLVVVESADMELAFLVDRVLAVERIPLTQIQKTADTVRGLRPEYVQGVAERKRSSVVENNHETMVIVLDLPSLLADERLIVHEEIV